jgi:hypothetical protein
VVSMYRCTGALSEGEETVRERLAEPGRRLPRGQGGVDLHHPTQMLPSSVGGGTLL